MDIGDLDEDEEEEDDESMSDDVDMGDRRQEGENQGTDTDSDSDGELKRPTRRSTRKSGGAKKKSKEAKSPMFRVTRSRARVEVCAL